MSPSPDSTKTNQGHVFIMRGDLLSLDCDAYGVSSDSSSSKPSSAWKTQLHDHHVDDVAAEMVDKSRGVHRLHRKEKTYPAGYVVPIAGHHESGVEWFTKAIEVFLRCAFRDVQSGVSSAHAGNIFKRPLPRIALPLLGSGGGGFGKEQGELLRATLDTLQRFVREHPADVVLVLAQDEAYDAAQMIRRRSPEQWFQLLDAKFHHPADRLAETARRGELALFIGAGVSMSAGLPSWGKLLKNILSAHAAIFPPEFRDKFDSFSPLDQAEYMERVWKKRSSDPLRPQDQETTFGYAVAQQVRGYERHSLTHGLLAALPVREVVTTNYDTLFEKAFNAARRKIDKDPCEHSGEHTLHLIPYEGPPAGGRPWLMKLHGCVDHPKDIVLSRRTFFQYDTQRSALAGLLAGLLVTRHMLFVGSSFNDDNVLRIAEGVQRLWSGGETVPRAEGPKMGTNLAVGRDSPRSELWKGDVDWVALGDGGDGGRRLEIFLDRVLTQSASGARYLLDDRFATMLSDEEKDARKALKTLLDEADPAKNAPLYEALAPLRAHLTLKQSR